ncbi:MAG: hypothetical protein LH629_00005, partial [Ignavibacteria bacterium]|nr:hypothetical protein [Ignavibacteria bacterium]
MFKIIFKIVLYTCLYYFSVNFCCSQIIPEGWSSQNSNLSTTLNSVYSVDSQIGWCIGDSGKILKTSNSGINWFQQNSGTNNSLQKVIFTSMNTGYIIGASNLILKTTNAGINWFQQNSGTTNPINSMSFANDSVGYISGLNKTILKTSNGGNNWNSLPFHDSLDFYSIYFINTLTGWLSGEIPNASSDTSSILFKTTNGGVNWFSQFRTHTEYSPFLSIQFSDSLNGWMVKHLIAIDFSVIFKTNNGGYNWEEYPLGGSGSYSLFFINERKGWASGPGRSIYSTINGGINWVRANAFSGYSYKSIFFTDSLKGWAVGEYGTILKTTTGGVLTSFTNQSTEIPDKYFLLQNYPNPFNPNTIISFSILENVKSEMSTSHGGSNEKLINYSSLGNEVATLVNERKNAGSYEVEFNGSNFSSGIYFYSLTVDGNLIDTKKMILLK